MNLIGNVKHAGAEFILAINDIAKQETMTLISRIHPDDRAAVAIGGEAKHPILNTLIDIKQHYNNEYVIESIRRSKVTGKVSKYGTGTVLEEIQEAIGFARGYTFKSENIVLQEKNTFDGKVFEKFNAADSKLDYRYETANGLYQSMYLNNGSTYLSVQAPAINLKQPSPFNPKGLEYRELFNVEKKRTLVASLKKIDFEVLSEFLDMSWYKVGDKKVKDYKSITSNFDFERYIMTPLIQKIIENKKLGKKTDVALDTETSGLRVYNLSPDNPDKDHCVAIPICWEVGKSFVIFTDMEHFENADNEYVAKRLAELFEMFNGERTIEYYDFSAFDQTSSPGDKDDATEIQRSTSFGVGGIELPEQDELEVHSDTDEVQSNSVTGLPVLSVTIKREDVNLIGHNSGFDGRVFFDLGVSLWFDEDTLQMAFVLNPQRGKGSRKLKVLTRYFFNAETPELEDILGKGNEDKYRYLQDRETAEIYGCADSDYTLAIYYKLKALMSDKLYLQYKKQDIPMINILYKSEYYGMMSDIDAVKELGRQTKENIMILEEAMYSYVGAYLDYCKKRDIIKSRWDSGQYASEQEFQDALNSIVIDENARYEFEFKTKAKKTVIYDIMKYPILSFTEGKNGKPPEPSLDKYACKRLLRYKLQEGEEPVRAMKQDLLVSGASRAEYDRLRAEGKHKQADQMCLISAKKFNKLKYPLALILQEHSALSKEYSSYYKPLETTNLESKLFYSYSLSRIETRRIMNPGQTMKGNLKALIKAYSDDYYILDFDMSQVEYRIMLSLAKFTAMVNRMKDPECDYHTETASMVEGIPAHRITKKQRKSAKSVSFGVPYGLGDASLCETMHGEVNEANLIETRRTLTKWKKSNAPVINLLETARYNALREWEISDDFRNFIDAWKKDENGEYLLDEHGNKVPYPVGKVENILGFYRIFNLSNVDLSEKGEKRRAEGHFNAAESGIRRKAGNYPIQATASEIFRLILIRFYEACERYGIQDKVIWHMLIHDELLCSVKKDVHPFLLYKLIKEACMITMKEHTNYFVGINMGDTWAEAKDDSREAPIHFVNRIIERWNAGEFEDGPKWFDHPWDFIKPYLEEYKGDRIQEVIQELQPSFPEQPLDLESLLEKFSNYTVRAMVRDYPHNTEVTYKADPDDPDSVAKEDDLKWISSLESWALKQFKEPVQFKDLEGNVYTVQQGETKETKESNEVDFDALFAKEGIDDFADFFSDDFEIESEESLDSKESWESYNSGMSKIYDSKAGNTEVDESSTGNKGFHFNTENSGPVNSIMDLVVIERRYQYIKKLNEQLVIELPDKFIIPKLKVFLADNVVKIGSRVIFKYPGGTERWEKLRMTADLDELDKVIDALSSIKYGQVKVVDKNIFIRLKSRAQERGLSEALMAYPGMDYKIYFVHESSMTEPIGVAAKVSIEKLEGIVSTM